MERDIAESSLRNPDQIITRVKELLWRYGNVVRREDLLKKACEEMEEMKTHYCAWDFLSAPMPIRSRRKKPFWRNIF